MNSKLPDWMNENGQWFQTSSGRQVRLTAIQIHEFDRGFLEGQPQLIRERVLTRMPETARHVFPGAGVFVTPCEGPADRYPPLVFICEFRCLEPVEAGADFSDLVVVWFAEDITKPLPEFIAERIGGVDWERYAVDGLY